jgi:DNA-binding response OmpR family regulator
MDFSVFPEHRVLFWNDRSFRISPFEGIILKELWRNRPDPVPRDRIALLLWGDSDGPADERCSITGYIHRIKKRLRAEGVPLEIKNTRDAGWRIVV